MADNNIGSMITFKNIIFEAQDKGISSAQNEIELIPFEEPDTLKSPHKISNNNSYQKAKKALSTKDIVTAEAIITSLLNDPEKINSAHNQARLTSGLADALEKYPNKKAAIAHYREKAYHLWPENFLITKSYADMLFTQEKNNSAMALYEQALKISENEPEKTLADRAWILLRLGFLYHKIGKGSEAQQAVEEAIANYRTLSKMQPNKYSVHLKRSLEALAAIYQLNATIVHQKNNHVPETEKIYRELIEINSLIKNQKDENIILEQQGNDLFQLGSFIYCLEGRQEEAKEILNKALENYNMALSKADYSQIKTLKNNISEVEQKLKSQCQYRDYYRYRYVIQD
jgi:tetratricopeptide (TPR) repeat protein